MFKIRAYRRYKRNLRLVKKYNGQSIMIKKFDNPIPAMSNRKKRLADITDEFMR
jgi:hypothetical protein